MFSADYLKNSIQQLSESDPVAYAVPVFVLLIITEAIFDAIDHRHLYKTKDAFASIAMGTGSVFVNLTMKLFYFVLFTYIYNNFALFHLPADTWWAWLLLLFADDFSFYWHHRSSHQVRLLWAAHSNHHSSQHYNLSTALRQSWTEFIYKYLFWIWLPFMGFHPIMIFTMISLSLVYQFFLHTQVVRKLGFLELFMNTPSHHRVHHGTNIKYLDKNHAGIFIIWDKLFGTFEPEDEADAPVYGLTQNLVTFNPVRIASHEYEKIWEDLKKPISWKARLGYLFNPPGWSHDGSRKTTQQLVEEMAD